MWHGREETGSCYTVKRVLGYVFLVGKERELLGLLYSTPWRSLRSLASILHIQATPWLEMPELPQIYTLGKAIGNLRISILLLQGYLWAWQAGYWGKGAMQCPSAVFEPTHSAPTAPFFPRSSSGHTDTGPAVAGMSSAVRPSKSAAYVIQSISHWHVVPAPQFHPDTGILLASMSLGCSGMHLSFPESGSCWLAGHFCPRT